MDERELEAALAAIAVALATRENWQNRDRMLGLYGAKDALEIELLAVRRLDAKRFR